MKRILIVDDHPENLYLLRAILQGHGYGVEGARHGAEALAKARQAPPDLLISDLLMPVMDGYTLLRQWKADEGLRRIPFVVYTATYTDPKDERLALDLGADAFIIKPAEPEAFMAQIEAVIAACHSGTLGVPRETALLGQDANRQYSQVLVHKLEEKLLQLEQSEQRARQSERALRQERDLTQRYLDTVQAIMVALDAEGHITMVNRKGCETLGQAESALLGQNWFATCLPQPEGMDVRYPAFKRTMASELGGEKYLESAILCHDGSRRLIAWRNAYLRDETGAIVGTLGSGQDITERKAMEDQLRLAGAVSQHCTEGILVTDAEVNIIAVNPAFTAITGYSREEVLGQNPRMLHSGRQDPAFYQELWAELHENGQWRGEIWNRRKSGEIYPELLGISAVHDELGQVVNYLAVLTDIKDFKHIQDELAFLAHHDPLTSLPNRTLFNELLGQAIVRVTRTETQLALLLLDLDRFKNVNDSLGHAVGDRLLVEVAQRLKETLRGVDIVSRIGGDEFNLLLDQLDAPADAGLAAERLIAAIAQPYEIDGNMLYVGASIGITLWPSDAHDIPTLHRNADTALHHAKAEGRGTYRYFAKELAESARARQAMETLLRQAMDEGQLELHYQPQVILHDGRLMGVEALARWNSPTQGAVSPARFIPLAEETGLIVALGDWALKTACQQMRHWLEGADAPSYVAVNVSAMQLTRGNLVESVRAALFDSGIDPGHLELEITESFVMTSPDAAMATLDALKALGVRMAIDDFGTGYSSLAYLKRLPVSRLKVDQGFVRDMLEDANDLAIVTAVISLGHSLGLDVLAEGVETEAHAEKLRLLGCDAAQGWLYGRPGPASALASAKA